MKPLKPRIGMMQKLGNGAVLLSLGLLLTACNSLPTQVTSTKTQKLQTPEGFLVKSLVPEWNLTDNESLRERATQYRNLLEQCNADKDSIIEWQKQPEVLIDKEEEKK